ncbi:hypothetical protein BRC88_08400 [Halobacteriales archaeon QS_4_69_225]|nr:MAG: hypothetical protein BRC88_08400 [Halobacteriales archaeon QS_4_69_225]
MSDYKMNDKRAADAAAYTLSRRTLLATATISFTAGCQAVGQFSDEQDRSVEVDCDTTGGWHQYQADPANTGARRRQAPSFDSEPTSINVVSERSGGIAVDAERRVFVSDKQDIWATEASDEGEIWRRGFGSLVSSTPILTCNAVVVQTSANTYALDKTDGTTLWKASPGNQFAEPLADGHRLFIASGAPAALDIRDGSSIWAQELDGIEPWGCCLGDETLVIAGETDDGGALVGVDAATGEHQWRTDIQRPVKASPTYDNGTAYVPDEGNQLIALAVETGTVEWQTEPYGELSGNRRATTPTVTTDTIVVPSGNGGRTVGVDRVSGETLWELDSGPTLAPPLAAENEVIVGTMNEGIFRIGTDGAVDDRLTDTRVGSQMALTDAGLFYKTAGLEAELVHLKR